MAYMSASQPIISMLKICGSHLHHKNLLSKHTVSCHFSLNSFLENGSLFNLLITLQTHSWHRQTSHSSPPSFKALFCQLPIRLSNKEQWHRLIDLHAHFFVFFKIYMHVMWFLILELEMQSQRNGESLFQLHWQQLWLPSALLIYLPWLTSISLRPKLEANSELDRLLSLVLQISSQFLPYLFSSNSPLFRA